jgi:cobyrinic acid a,c-diamide synthase
VQPRTGSDSPQPNGYAKDNLIGSYVHLHFAHDLQLAANFVAACAAWQARHAK